MKASPVIIAVLVIVATLPVAPLTVAAQPAQPTLPHYFYGTLSIDGAPAPAGTTVEARVPGAQTDARNPITTTQAGKYGDADPLATAPRLVVQGSIAEEATIEFFINGARAVQTSAWQSGKVTELNLTAGAADTAGPSVTLNPVTPNPTGSTSIVLTGSATDSQSNITQVEYKLDMGSWMPAAAADGTFNGLSEGFTFTLAGLSAGTHGVSVRAKDLAGNFTAQAEWASDSFVVDREPPVLTLNPVAPDPTASTTLTLTGSATDSQSNIALVEHQSDAGAWMPATPADGAFDEPSEAFTVTLSGLANGSHTVRVRASDAAGNNTPQAGQVSDAFEVAAPVPSGAGSVGGGGGGLPPPAPATVAPAVTVPQMTGFTADSTLTIDNQTAAVMVSVRLRSQDERAVLDINWGTKMRDASGQPAKTLKVQPAASPPTAPAGNSILAAHDFGPDGATFDPPITLTLKYDPQGLPAGVQPAQLKIGWWNGQQWLKLETTVSPDARTASAKVSHFTNFAILAPVPVPPATTAPVAAPPPSTEPPPPAPPAAAQPPAVAPAPPAAAQPAPDPAPDPTPAPEPPPAPAPAGEGGTDWLLAGGIAAAVVAAAVYLVRRSQSGIY